MKQDPNNPNRVLIPGQNAKEISVLRPDNYDHYKYPYGSNREKPVSSNENPEKYNKNYMKSSIKRQNNVQNNCAKIRKKYKIVTINKRKIIIKTISHNLKQ
jgi:hypothetical protein